MTVYAVVLAGGGGTRLWPASRRVRPKQFLPLAPGGRSLLEATVARARRLVPAERVLVVTSGEQADAVRATLPELPAANVLVEPVGRSTAPAVALAARTLAARGEPGALLAVLPSDHAVGDEAAFLRTLEAALAAARTHLVTVGIPPAYPSTGYGYLELGDRTDGPAREVRRFVEKPDAERARAFVASGRYLWNSGMFFFRACRILDEVRRHLPEVWAALESDRYAEAPTISLDYGVMERTEDIWAVPGEFGWCDLGHWADLAAVHPPDADGHVRVGGPLLALDARDNVVVGAPLVALVGVEGLVVVATEDAVLVVPRARAQEVRRVVGELKTRGLEQYL